MSLYNMMFGMTKAVLFILPMLGKHPDEYPRFRDCFVADDYYPNNDHIIIYTRTGGGNRDDYVESNDAMRAMEGFVGDYDDDYDRTYANWVFQIPPRWEADFKAIAEGRFLDVSSEYKEQIKNIFPKLSSTVDDFFLNSNNQQGGDK